MGMGRQLVRVVEFCTVVLRGGREIRNQEAWDDTYCIYRTNV